MKVPSLGLRRLHHHHRPPPNLPSPSSKPGQALVAPPTFMLPLTLMESGRTVWVIPALAVDSSIFLGKQRCSLAPVRNRTALEVSWPSSTLGLWRLLQVWSRPDVWAASGFCRTAGPPLRDRVKVIGPCPGLADVLGTEYEAVGVRPCRREHRRLRPAQPGLAAEGDALGAVGSA